MPVKTEQLMKEKRKIILDIIFENIIPTSPSKLYWDINMLTAEVRKHNIDDRIHITRYDIKRIVNSISKNKKVNLHMINNNLFISFS